MHFGTIFSSETSSQHLKWLGYMHIHFISIKISIIRWRDWQVQSKCWVWHDFNLVPHDRHLMYTRLLIEKNKVSIIQMSHHLWNTCWISVFLKNVRTKWNNHYNRCLPYNLTLNGCHCSYSSSEDQVSGHPL